MLTAAWALALLLRETPAKVSPEFTRLTAQLEGSPEEQVKAFDFVVAHAATDSSVLMFIAAAKGVELGRLEDASFLFFAAQLRSRFDLARFPPAGAGADGIALALAAVNQQVGSTVNPAIMRQPQSFKAAVDRFRAWDVETAPGYEPDWEHTAAKPAAEMHALATKMKHDSLELAEGLSTLLNTPEYFAALKTIQEYTFGPLSEVRKPERIAAKEAAEKRAREIEEKMGIQGVFYRKPSPSPSPAPAKPRPHS